MRRSVAPAGAALLGLALLSCEDEPILTRIPPPAVQVDVLAQKPAALVDILWVVDNSGTMAQEQEALARNFDGFITGLTTCQGTGVENDVCDFETKTCMASGAPCNPPNYHIGVISTDLQSSFDSGRLRRVGLCTTAAGATPSMGRYRYCLDNAECAHDPSDPSSDPANSVCDMNQAVSFVTATTPGASAAFSRAVRVGTSGSGRETGIEAAAAALGRATDRSTGQFVPAPSENQGFLRPDASLFVIFVSDEDDNSFGQPTYFYRAFETLKGAGNEGLVSISAIVGDPDADGPDGVQPGGCTVPNPGGGDPVRNAAGTRYVALAMYSRGLSAEFRVCDDQRLTCPAGQACQAPVPDLPGVCVPSAGQCMSDADCGNFQCSGDRGCITCTNGQCQTQPELFLELLERNGVFGSICAPDYGRVLSALGFEAAGLARKFALTETPNCFGDPVPCCADGVADDACEATATMCVRVDGQPVPNERASGWVYDVGGNAVFFDGSFVPKPNSEVQISYRSTSSDDNAPCAEVLQ